MEQHNAAWDDTTGGQEYSHVLVTHAAHPVPAAVGVLAALLAHTLAARPARRASVDDDAQLRLAAATRSRRLLVVSPYCSAPPQPRQLRLEAAVGERRVLGGCNR